MSSKPILRPVVPPGLNVKLIGLGGVGGPVARYLSTFLAAQPSPSRLVLLDGDAFEPRNTSRMAFGRLGNKADVLRDEVLARVADSPLTVEAVREFVTPDNIARLVLPSDTVILAVDNHATRKLVNDHCNEHLADFCLISGGNDGVRESTEPPRRGTYGNVQVYWRRAGRDLTPSLTRYHPEIDQPSDKLPSELSCTELADSVPQILFTNLTVASTILNSFLLCLSDALPYQEVAFDIAEGLMRPIKYCQLSA